MIAEYLGSAFHLLTSLPLSIGNIRESSIGISYCLTVFFPPSFTFLNKIILFLFVLDIFPQYNPFKLKSTPFLAI